MLTAVWVAAAVVVVISLPRWLPGRVVALRGWVFTRINGEESITVPGDLVGVDRFREVYSHPAASGRSEGAALSDLFWYWLSPGPEMHQEHLEAGERYDAVALATRRILSVPRARVEELTRSCVVRALEGGRGDRRRVVRLRDLMMPVWAEFSYELVFGEPCPPHARDLIVGNADDVVTALKCCGLRHMDRRDRLTAYLVESLPRVKHELPAGLTTRECALYLQGAFFNTAVVQMSEATAHVLMALARHPDVQARARAGDDRYLDQVIAETLRLYPLFGIAHRITTGDIPLGEDVVIPAGSVLCFDYPAFHRAGFPDPGRFDPGRFAPGHAPVRELNHIPFGMPANRPCPAWRLAPLALRVAVREILRAYELDSTAAHTRSLPNRGPCLLTPLDPAGSAAARHGPGRRLTLLYMRLKDGWEDVWRSLVQLVLGTYMVWDARRLRLCERHFSGHARTEGT
ncbi:cytochrome P450 [Microbispora sp. SCL1-1]|uniref:cytochrome P450 n=1 Tax=unclassified Microbispora TaxID=2614687 RepID=UPI00115A6EA0|nr:MULTISPECIES: cytochrome P450 [unclassified Microbispora]NJP26625.1 cytochrome P450 [Microbispora sp. CL1-1]TQS12133.1 cytochrome P450 [Microbispora sp. SCL1-1]